LATVLFTDVVRSTERAATVGDRTWRQFLDRHDAIINHQLRRFRGKLVKLTGDGILATFDGPGRGVQCALELQNVLKDEGITIRAGVHTGEVEIRGNDLAGMAVHIAARVMGEAKPSEVLASSTVRDLVVGSDIAFEYQGEYELKGVPGTWRLYATED
jgi:class 3 adenylate cyclase